jgi:flagellar basal-body rod protein FlgG
MNQLQQQMDLIGHNLANSATPGYKSGQAEFSALLFNQLMNGPTQENDTAGRSTPEGIRVGSGARLGAIHPNMLPGVMQETDRDLDVALHQPHHFFQIQGENDGEEIRYTRDGSFYLQPVNNGTEVMLVTKDGSPVLGENGRIQFSASVQGVEILNDGTIFVQQGSEKIDAGRLAVAAIDRVRLLESMGNNVFRLPAGFNLDDLVQDVPQGEDLMQQKRLEMSNVNLAEEMAGLIGAQRAYQMNARGLTMADQMQGLINSIR